MTMQSQPYERSYARLVRQSQRYGVPVRPATLSRAERVQWAGEIDRAREQAQAAQFTAYNTPSTQAARIVRRFGGVLALSRALIALSTHTGDPRDAQYARKPMSVYRWVRYHGYIPIPLWPGVKKAARYAGVKLTRKDFAIEPERQKGGGA